MKNINPNDSEKNRAGPELNIEKQIKGAKFETAFIWIVWLFYLFVVSLGDNSLSEWVAKTVLVNAILITAMPQFLLNLRFLQRTVNQETTADIKDSEEICKARMLLKSSLTGFVYIAVCFACVRDFSSEWLINFSVSVLYLLITMTQAIKNLKVLSKRPAANWRRYKKSQLNLSWDFLYRRQFLRGLLLFSG